MIDDRQNIADAAAVVGIAYVAFWLSGLAVGVVSVALGSSLVRREPWAFPTLFALQWIVAGSITGGGIAFLIRRPPRLAWVIGLAVITGVFFLTDVHYSGAPWPGKVGEAAGRALLAGVFAAITFSLLSKGVNRENG